MSEFYNDQWYDERWASMPPVMRKIASDAVKKAISEADFELIRRKHAQHGHDWIHHLIDHTPEECAEMDALLGMDAPEDAAWPMTSSAHHGFGTSIRNLLRDEELGAGIADSDLPPAPYESGESHQNWDDYYCAVIEAAAGLREV